MHPDLAPEKLLTAYAVGIFPMADEKGEVHWLSPDPRAVIELDAFKVSRSLRAVTRRGVFDVTINRAFHAVIDACADRPEGTWISDEIKRAYRTLHRLGFAHSVEGWRDGQLAGGLYGIVLGGAFFGESMFHRVADASKVALVHLVERMRGRGFVLLDVQFMTEHLRRFGAVEIPSAEYGRQLQRALVLPCTFV
ncbi:MAG: leucyl/phenylalanyl-tRNA--protein transferase [Phycisphaerae bacterium]